MGYPPGIPNGEEIIYIPSFLTARSTFLLSLFDFAFLNSLFPHPTSYSTPLTPIFRVPYPISYILYPMSPPLNLPLPLPLFCGSCRIVPLQPFFVSTAAYVSYFFRWM
ncbi:hypothetical protein FRB91_003765 [Serendipita sp. 411]|nr:hypothetical protein FRB91_003765 [Serendipita sp. 411]